MNTENKLIGNKFVGWPWSSLFGLGNGFEGVDLRWKVCGKLDSLD